jgi:hypothetical protein
MVRAIADGGELRLKPFLEYFGSAAVNVFLAGICRCAQRAGQSLTIPQT